jgi:D-glycero-D-manno-heptose 1,7-bisphosphate phosphatase
LPDRNARRPAVFLDRDGTIIEDRGYLADPAEARLFPDAARSLRALSKLFSLFIVTNQAGVAEGVIGLEDVDHVNADLVARLEKEGVRIAGVYVCPHRRTDGCDCRKPNPYFLLQAARDFQLDLRRSFVVGDHPSDVALAENAGARGVYVLTGHGPRHLSEVPAGVVVVEGIREATCWILSRARAEGLTRMLRSGANHRIGRGVE